MSIGDQKYYQEGTYSTGLCPQCGKPYFPAGSPSTAEETCQCPDEVKPMAENEYIKWKLEEVEKKVDKILSKLNNGE